MFKIDGDGAITLVSVSYSVCGRTQADGNYPTTGHSSLEDVRRVRRVHEGSGGVFVNILAMLMPVALCFAVGVRLANFYIPATYLLCGTFCTCIPWTDIAADLSKNPTC